VQTSESDEVRLIRLAACLWIIYLIVLAVIARFDVPRQADLYYILNGVVALICLSLSYWEWIQHKLRNIFVPLIVAIITILPVVNNWVAMWLAPHGPPFPPEGPVQGILPFMLVALLLVAWKYTWRHVLLLILGVAVLNLAMVWTVTPPGSVPFPGGINMTLIQTVVFLVVGFSISFLMGRLREQQRSLEEANKRLTHYAGTLEKLATSRERNRLARELHDTLAHTLSGLSVQLEAVDAYWIVDPKAARSMLDQSLAVAHVGLEETRRALKALRASPLDDLGLALALTSMVKETTANSSLALELAIMEEIPALAPDVEQCIYRIAQEAVANVIKHSDAGNLLVKLESHTEKVTLTVQDDGQGFNTEKDTSQAGYGLVGMRERAQLAGADLIITSSPKSGTTIKLTVQKEN